MVDIGTTAAGGPANIDLEELLATRLLVQGNSGSGKSHLLRRLIEQSAALVQQVIVDPEEDFLDIASAFGHIVVDASGYTDNALYQIALRAREHRVSIILSLGGLETVETQMLRTASFLSGLFDADRDHWHPILVAVDEAQVFAPSGAREFSDDARRASLGAMTNLMCRGRKRGLCGVIATQRLAKLAKNVAAEASNFLMGRTFLDIDMERAADLLGISRKDAEMFRNLSKGNFFALGPALARRPVQVRIGAVQTGRKASGPVLSDLPQTSEQEARSLLFAPTEQGARSVVKKTMYVRPESLMAVIESANPVRPTLSVMTPLSASDSEEDMPANRPTVVSPAESCLTAQPISSSGSYDDIISAMLASAEGGVRTSDQLHQLFLAQCRAIGLNGRLLDPSQFRRKVALARTGLDLDALRAEFPYQWGIAESVAQVQSDDVYAIYLQLAAAALKDEKCPSDQSIAKAIGSSSARRANAFLLFLEARSLIRIIEEMNGQRTILIPAIEKRTAPNYATDSVSGATNQ